MAMAKRTLAGLMRTTDGFWRTVNGRKPRILIYTDSRGMNVSSRTMAVTKHHYGSHVDALQRRFHTTHVVCPFSHTTVLDFLTYLDRVDAAQFDHVVMQCGIVDFSPRPISSLSRIRSAKAGLPRFERMFDANAEHHATSRGEPYEGEATTTLYSVAYAKELIAELRRLDNLIWVSSNNFVRGWNGNWRARPDDIDATVRAYDDLMLQSLPATVDLHRWTDHEIQQFTVDNIHFTRTGFRRVRDEVITAIVGSASAQTPA